MQHTVAKTIQLTDIGLHSGVETTMTIKPADADTGIVIVRNDVADRNNTIAVRWDHVVDTRLCTVVGNKDGVTVGTVEHIMAALRACDIDNAILELDGPEIPVFDGSSRPFIRAIDATGVKSSAAPRKGIRILKEVRYEEGDKWVVLKPGVGSTFDVTIDFDNKSIGRQSAKLDLYTQDFESQMSDARTFGFLHEVNALRQQGLALGGSLDNAVVIDGEKIMNPEGTRYDNEFARHKLLDAVGDIYLAGGPLLGAYQSFKAGHAMNNKALHALFADPTSYEIVDLFVDREIHPCIMATQIQQSVETISA
jgi:UDP-3-O-[3-hydroxymyristoyl] N-acetylglucosamine deacetylase